MPACRGNYSKEEKVSTFHFPRDESERRKWIKAVRRDNFTPTEHSVVSNRLLNKPLTYISLF